MNQILQNIMLAFEYRANNYMKQNNLKKTLDYLNKALIIGAKFHIGRLFFKRALVKKHLKDYQGAIKDLDKLLELEPNHIKGYVIREKLFKLKNNKNIKNEQIH